MLEVKDINVFRGKQILWNLAMRVEKREIVTVLGANGAGKTSLVESIGVHHPKTGTITFLNEGNRRPSFHITRMGIACVPEGDGFLRNDRL
jgi:branched-chain amino acid transport system ATP-binding protein